MQAVETLINTQAVHKRILNLMDNQFEISVVADDDVWADARIDDAIAEIKRIGKMLDMGDDSPMAEINRNAGKKPVKVNGEIYKLVARSIEISNLTHGAFDITTGFVQPKKAKPTISYQNIILNAADNTVFLKKKGMRIDFSRVGKGYAADRAKYILQILGVGSGVVNAGGDLITWGTQPNGQPWTIGIADPNQNTKPFSALNISNMAVTTLGGLGPYAVNADGVLEGGVKSVSMMSTSAELAEAMATPLMHMGAKLGLDLINQLQQVACVIIDEFNYMHTSKSISFIN